MAVLKNVLLAAAVLASSTLAAPWGPGDRGHGFWSPRVKTVTEWVTVAEQATVWVDGQGKPIATDFPGEYTSVWTAPAAETTPIAETSAAPEPTTSAEPTYAAPSSTVTSAPVVVVSSTTEEPTSTEAPYTPPAPSSSTSASSSPVYSPAVFNSEPEPTSTYVYVPETTIEATTSVEPTTSAAAPTTEVTTSAAPTTSAAETTYAVPSSTTSTAAAAVSAYTSSSSSGGACEGSSTSCTGDITHWDGGLGACGWTVDTTSDLQIALPYELMGTQSNGNPYCGRSLTIVATDGSLVKATVGDKCMGCTGYSIDLTNILFTTVAPNGDGRVSDIHWYFD